jgi:hypothetical protein
MRIKTMRKIFLSGLVIIITIVTGFLMFTSSFANPHQQDSCEDGQGFRVSSGVLSQWPNTDFCNFIYPSSNGFASGGVPRDGIPPLYPAGYIYPDGVYRYGGEAPAYTVAYETVETANTWLVDDHPVIVLEINDDARAYPLGILTRHEIANTVVGDIPVAVTFCPLCNTGVVFDRRVGNRELHFGVSGFLRFSDMVMWDHETETWWQQSTGEGLVGELAGEQLSFISASMTSYAQFRQQYPDGQVLSAEGRRTNFNPYVGYDSSTQPFLYNGFIDERLEATARVLGYRHRGEDGTEIFTAYPFELLEEVIVVNDTVGGEARVVFWQPGARSALDTSNIDEAREVGAANLFSPVLQDGTVLKFLAEGTIIKDEQTGSTWNIFGVATAGELAGTRLRQITAINHFWFAWQAFHGATILWEVGTTTDALIASNTH